MQAIVLAAGRGSRLGPISLLSSKPALPLLGKPLAVRVHDSLVHLVDRTVFVVNPRDVQLLNILNTPPFTNENREIVTQDVPLGSADALLKAWPLVDEKCMVTGCDNLMATSFLERFIEQFNREKPDVLVGVAEFDLQGRLPGSVVALDECGLISQIVEKPSASQLLSNKTALPIYAFRSSFGRYLYELLPSERAEYELPQAIQNLINQGGVVAASLAPGRVSINDAWEYLQAAKMMLAEQRGAKIEPGARIEPEAIIKPPVYIESKSHVEAGATIGPYAYVMSGSEVQNGAVVQDAIVYKDAIVECVGVIRGKIVLPDQTIDPQKFHDSHDPAHHR
jgi:NDP-sugar pyrophosphorylase family protein